MDVFDVGLVSVLKRITLFRLFLEVAIVSLICSRYAADAIVPSMRKLMIGAILKSLDGFGNISTESS